LTTGAGGNEIIIALGGGLASFRFRCIGLGSWWQPKTGWGGV